MMRSMLKSKIHRATVTDANLNYEGSLTIDRALMDEVGLIPFEQIMVYNVNNGERFETYAIEGPADSGMIALNGAAARKGMIGDLIIIVTYGLYAPEELQHYAPKIIVLDKDNLIKKRVHTTHPPVG
ncbi:MAG: aspartate 1-decarboxylase [Thermodesulfobacteriota bacterium]